MKIEDIKVGMKVKLLSKSKGWESGSSIEDFFNLKKDDTCIDFFTKNGYGVIQTIYKDSEVVVGTGVDNGWIFGLNDIEPYVEPIKFKVGDKVKLLSKTYWKQDYDELCDYIEDYTDGCGYIIEINENPNDVRYVVSASFDYKHGGFFREEDLELVADSESIQAEQVEVKNKTLLEQLKENPNLELWKMSPKDTTYRVELKDGRTYKAKMLNANCGQFTMVTDIGLLILKLSDIEAMYPKKDK